MSNIEWHNRPLAPLGGVGVIEAYTWANDENLAASTDQWRKEHRARMLANMPESERGETPVQTASRTTFYPKEDVIDTLPDGRCIAVYRANMPMPIAEARRRGLVVDTPAPEVVTVTAEPPSGEDTTADSPSDKRQAVVTALAQHPELSDREIARRTGASNTYVSKLRKQQGGAA